MVSLCGNGLREEILSLHHVYPSRTCNPWGRANFDPSAIILIKLIEVYYTAKFGSPMPYGFRQEDFQRFPNLLSNQIISRNSNEDHDV